MLDPVLDSVLEEIVREAGQPGNVARRLRAWLVAMSEDFETKDDETRYLKSVCESLDLEDEDAD